MSYQRKTKDEFVLIANYGYGYGWEEETTEESYKAIRERLKEILRARLRLGKCLKEAKIERRKILIKRSCCFDKHYSTT
jgi:hypothetical protein